MSRKVKAGVLIVAGVLMCGWASLSLLGMIDLADRGRLSFNDMATDFISSGRWGLVGNLLVWWGSTYLRDRKAAE